MRRFIRHPTDIPLEFQVETICPFNQECLVDVAPGGLCFRSSESVSPGSLIMIRINAVTPPFEAKAQVVWCREREGEYDVGIAFEGADQDFLVRMVEQVCYIESYKQRVLNEQGRNLSGEEAAREWIERYAEDFPC